MSSSRTLVCRVAAFLTVLLPATEFAQFASATTIYTETFDNPTGNVAASTVGWFAYGGSGCEDVSSFGGNTSVSYYAGTGSTPGLLFTLPGAYTDARSLVGTTEFSAIDRSKYSSLSISWDQWVADTGLNSQLAVNVAGTWYVSKNVFSNTWTYTDSGANSIVEVGDVKSLAISSASGWYALTVTPGTTNGLNVGTTEVNFPTTGNIVGAGLYCTGPAAALCIDNFQISGTAIPEPSTLMLCATGLIGLLAYAWRKRK